MADYRIKLIEDTIEDVDTFEEAIADLMSQMSYYITIEKMEEE